MSEDTNVSEKVFKVTTDHIYDKVEDLEVDNHRILKMLLGNGENGVIANIETIRKDVEIIKKSRRGTTEKIISGISQIVLTLLILYFAGVFNI